MFQMILALALLYITDMQWQKSYDYETVYKTNKFVADFIWCKINSELMYDFSIKKRVNLPKIAKKCVSFLNTYVSTECLTKTLRCYTFTFEAPPEETYQH